MQIYNGKSVFGGIAIGKISVYQKKEQQVKRVKIDDPEQEMARYEKAKAEGIKQLQGLYDKALREVGEANAAIFEVHQMMMEDDGYNESVENIIRSQGVNAEYAVATTGDNYAQMFSAMDDDYMRERAADVRDISERLLTILNGEETGAVDADEPKIIVAEDLAPSETVQLDKDKVLSFVTVKGSLNSHTAILARTMAIPALVNTSVSLESEMDGRLGIVDGADGTFYVDPDEETLAEMKKRQEEDLSRKQLLLTLKGKENVTLDGQKVMLYANIGNIKDLATVIQNDAGGIGLFRSEFIYLEKEDFPTEEEQFQIYRQVAQTMAGKRVIIRTLDIGADKQCDYFHMEHEENPALGCRAIRICLTRPEIFKTQLRALFRASAFGKIAIMYPMITSVQEVRKIKGIVEEVKAELTAQGVEFGNPEQGIMIETPAAAIISDDLAKEVDFFSIGTNDLSQYTMAIDRQNPQLDLFFDPHHPAVLRMISLVMENAHKAGIWAGICGELGADQSLTKEFLAMGVDELSVSPGSILPLRKIILETNVTDYKAGKRMLTQQRHEIILELLREKGSITVTEVKDLLDTSESTVRRDITALDKEGKLEKVFGGAVELKERVTAYEYSVAEKMGLKLEEKDRIAKYAAGLIQDEDFVYIDAGTTTGDILKFLKVTRAVFVTNAVVHAQTLAGRGFKVLLVGGELKSTTEAVIGNQAMNTIRGYHFTKGFFGTNGLTRKSGCTTPDANEAAVKAAAMEQCRECYVLCDSSKFDNISSVTFADFYRSTIITDRIPSGYEDCANIIEVQKEQK